MNTEEIMSPTAASPTIQVEGNTIPCVQISKSGEVILVVTFETSKATIQAARRQASKTIPRASVAPPSASKPTATLAYRVRLQSLKKESPYFAQLLGTDIFKEGRDLAAALAGLQLKNANPADAELKDLPRVRIVDDDEATKSVGREEVFGDLMRILHGEQSVTKPSIAYLASLAVMADRFDCAPTVARYVKVGLKGYKWPATPSKPGRDQGSSNSLSIAAEEMLRQKILVSWVLDLPLRLAASTRELILRGSSKWFSALEATSDAVWWDLPDGLEGTFCSS